CHSEARPHVTSAAIVFAGPKNLTPDATWLGRGSATTAAGIIGSVIRLPWHQSQLLGQVVPHGVRSLDQRDLFPSAVALDLLLARDGRTDIPGVLEPHQAVHVVLR